MTKFPADRQAGKLQIITNNQFFLYFVLVIDDWNLFGDWCLVFGYSP
jgi:hypothetical protein